MTGALMVWRQKEAQPYPLKEPKNGEVFGYYVCISYVLCVG